VAHAKLSLALCLLLLIAAPAASASAWQSATLKVALRPERLGGRTTIMFGFRIVPHNQPVPSPLVEVSLFYPRNIGLVTSGLGLETCAAIQLELLGQCPPNSLMGYGKALGELEVESEIITEEGRITTWMAPIENGHLGLLFYTEGHTPVSSEKIFTSQLDEAPPPYGGQLATTVPIIRTWPEGPDISVVAMTSTIGPMNVTYYAWYRGKRVPYHPNGLRLPETCPHGGFPFAAEFSFLDGSHTHAQTRVPCPTSKPQQRGDRTRALRQAAALG
jgi:hypothetical protein